MRIGVISDTHIPRRSKGLPKEVYEIFDGVDLILHAGDLLIEDVITELEALAPVYAVAGNNDSFDILNRYGIRKIIEANGKKIGLTHGYGYSRTYINAYNEFKDQDVDCIVYGHSHIPHNEVINGVLMFNPGSPTDRRFQSNFSLGVLHVEKDNIWGEIFYF